MKCQIALLLVSLILTTKAAENTLLQNQVRQAEAAELNAPRVQPEPEPQSETELQPSSEPRPGPVVAEGAVGTLTHGASVVRRPALDLPLQHLYPGLREGGYVSPRNIQGNLIRSDPRNQRSWTQRFSDVFGGGNRGGASASRASEPAERCRGLQCFDSLRRSPAAQPEPQPEPLGPDRWEHHYPGLREGGYVSPRDIQGRPKRGDPRNDPEWVNQYQNPS